MDESVKAQLDSCVARLQREGAAIIARRTDRVLSGKFLFTYLLFIPKLARVRALLRKSKEILGAKCCSSCGCHSAI